MARVLALDVGERRIGVAVSDPTGILARPLTTIVRASRQADFEAIAALLERYAIERVVVGLPLSLDGTEGPQAVKIRRYGERLVAALEVPIEFWDERYSSAVAIEILQEKGQSRRHMRDELDATAAAVILQSYLDAQKPFVEQDHP
jgi:putative Holliday junction resolvase